jgi:hypothetical protein
MKAGYLRWLLNCLSYVRCWGNTLQKMKYQRSCISSIDSEEWQSICNKAVLDEAIKVLKKQGSSSKRDVIRALVNIRRAITLELDTSLVEVASERLCRQGSIDEGTVDANWNHWTERMKIACDDVEIKNKMNEPFILLYGRYEEHCSKKGPKKRALYEVTREVTVSDEI